MVADGKLPTWKSDNIGITLQFRFNSKLPFPNEGFGDSNELGDLTLEQAEIHAMFPDSSRRPGWVSKGFGYLTSSVRAL
jgi:hypothetical protein